MVKQARVVQQRDAGGDGCLAHVDVGVVEERGRGTVELRSDAADLDERQVVLWGKPKQRLIAAASSSASFATESSHPSSSARIGPGKLRRFFSTDRSERASPRIPATYRAAGAVEVYRVFWW
ncbi:hypothetical protein ABZ478_38645 [Streptomyces sp. NPDC005706]|uniref:hypothetical protein n=1 Tax=Streptomyces sp. NPDC005706 TaxID=3157169 RepID=UPI0033FEF75D